MFRCYRELSKILSFEDRLAYLRLTGSVAEATFGFDRHMNQGFYHSVEWKQVRDYVITRDNGCDLGVPGYEIQSDPLVHHLEVMTKNDIIHGETWILDPEYLITTQLSTHNAIHYGATIPTSPRLVIRRPGDTTLW